jgi:hypothetical protein
MQGGVVEGQLVDGGPQVQDIALGSALGLETLEDVLAQVDRTGSSARGRGSCRFSMHGTGATSLLSGPLELAQEA